MPSVSSLHGRSRPVRRLLIGGLGILLLAPLTLVAANAAGASPQHSAAIGGDVHRLTLSTSQARFDAGVDNQGWWSNGQRNNDENDNYVVGECPQDECRRYSRYRNFFTFDVPELHGTVVAAKLVVRRYRGGENFTETLGLYKVRTPARVLNNNRGLNLDIYRDLGTGTSYGEFRVRTQGVEPASTVGFWLNDEAVADVNAASGRFFSIGGSLLSARRTDGHSDQLFGFSRGAGVQELRLFVEPPA